MLYVAVAVSSFRRYSTYTAATLAGIFTNSVFGVIISFSYIAVWKQNPHAGGYDVTDALTYCWLAQAMIMTVAIWGGGTTDDVAERIRTGDVAIDLYRPVSFLGWFLAGDLGRAAYHLLTRGVAPTVVGALLFDLALPDRPADLARLPGLGRARRWWSASGSGCWSASQRVLAARPDAALLTLIGGVRDVLLRARRAAGAVPRAVPQRRPGAAVVGVRPGADRHLARPARGLGRARRARLPGRLGRRAAARRAPACSALATRKVVVQGG